MDVDGLPIGGHSLSTAEGLRAAVALRKLADQLEDEYVARPPQRLVLLHVAEALNVTRQAVHKKHFSRLEATGVVTRKRDNRA